VGKVKLDRFLPKVPDKAVFIPEGDSTYAMVSRRLGPAFQVKGVWSFGLRFLLIYAVRRDGKDFRFVYDWFSGDLSLGWDNLGGGKA